MKLVLNRKGFGAQFTREGLCCVKMPESVDIRRTAPWPTSSLEALKQALPCCVGTFSGARACVFASCAIQCSEHLEPGQHLRCMPSTGVVMSALVLWLSICCSNWRACPENCFKSMLAAVRVSQGGPQQLRQMNDDCTNGEAPCLLLSRFCSRLAFRAACNQVVDHMYSSHSDTEWCLLGHCWDHAVGTSISSSSTCSFMEVCYCWGRPARGSQQEPRLVSTKLGMVYTCMAVIMM
jgi:hypothetical protein